MHSIFFSSLECVSSLVDLVCIRRVRWQREHRRILCTTLLQFWRRRRMEILSEKYVLRRNEKLLRNEHERRLIWIFWIFSFRFRDTGKWDHVRSLCSRPIFGSVALENAFETVLFLFSELTAQSHWTTTERRTTMANWFSSSSSCRTALLFWAIPFYFQFTRLHATSTTTTSPTLDDEWQMTQLAIEAAAASNSKNHVIWKIENTFRSLLFGESIYF